MKRLFIAAALVHLLASILICLSNLEVFDFTINKVFEPQNLAILAASFVYFALIYSAKSFEDTKNLRLAVYSYIGFQLMVRLSSFVFEPSTWFPLTCSLLATISLIVYIVLCFRIKSREISTSFKLIGTLEITAFVSTQLTPYLAASTKHLELTCFIPLYYNLPLIGILLLILKQDRAID